MSYEEELESRCEQLEKQIQELEERSVSLQNALGFIYSKISSFQRVSERLKGIEYDLLDMNEDIISNTAADISVCRTEINKLYDCCKDKCYDEILKWQKKDNDILGGGE